MKNQALVIENGKLLFDNDKLHAKHIELERKISDEETLVNSITDIAYKQACDVLVDEIVDKARAEDIAMIDKYKNWIESNQCKEPKIVKKTLVKHFDSLGEYIQQIGSKVITRIKDALMNLEKKSKLINQIQEKARPSTREILEKNRLLIEQGKSNRPKKHKECEVER